MTRRFDDLPEESILCCRFCGLVSRDTLCWHLDPEWQPPSQRTHVAAPGTALVRDESMAITRVRIDSRTGQPLMNRS